MLDLFSTECFFIQSSDSLILDNSSRYLSLFCSVIGGGILQYIPQTQTPRCKALFDVHKMCPDSQDSCHWL